MPASTATAEDMAGCFKMAVMGEMNERGFARDNMITMANMASAGLGESEDLQGETVKVSA